jgi:DNA phosphorothioation-dependent restriction protein DptF
MRDLTFRDTIDLLSKSSPEAVSTLDPKPSPARQLKEYLYVQTQIERDLGTLLDDSADPKRIIFLCGSSGDGKSEILCRLFPQYHDMFDFHIDATHSFDPNKDAIATLDEQFSHHKQNQRPLVVGINIGMLGNYAARGSMEHADITGSIAAFLRHDTPAQQHIFLNFEDYPKFQLDGDQVCSPFISQLLDRITNATEENPLYRAFLREQTGSHLQTNYRLLQLPEVKEKLVQLLLYVQLKFDQFLTARTILDFLYQVLTGPGYLFDNLFTSHGSDLMLALQHFDPCTVRSSHIDLFLIQYAVGIADPEFAAFRGALPPWLDIRALSSGSWIRLFYLLQDSDIGNNFHRRFAQDFRSECFEQYLTVWALHKCYTGDPEQRKRLRDFYQNYLIHALLRFANRFAPELTSRGELLLGAYNGYCLSTRADLRESLRSLTDHQPKRLGHFSACLRLGSADLRPVHITVNFLELILRIIRGYRPNKHDKNTIVILEEVIEEMTRVARGATRVSIHKAQEEWTLMNDVEEDEIRVEG